LASQNCAAPLEINACTCDSGTAWLATVAVGSPVIVVPVIVPPETLIALADCVAIVPRPEICPYPIPVRLDPLPVVVSKVPDVGKVTAVFPVNVPTKEYAPENVSAPPRETAFPPMLLTVVASDPAEFVTSPVNAGTKAVGSAPPEDACIKTDAPDVP